MNPRQAYFALLLSALAAGAFLVLLVLTLLTSGCAPGLPEEPPVTITNTADASRWHPEEGK